MLLLLESEKRDGPGDFVPQCWGSWAWEVAQSEAFLQTAREGQCFAAAGNPALWHACAFPYWPEWGREKLLH